MENLSCIPKFVKKEQTDLWVGEAWKLMLLKNTFIPNAATQQFVADVSPATYEITDIGGKYTAGGVDITGKASKFDPANTNNYFLDATDQVIGPGASLNYRYGIAYKDMGTGNQAVNPIRAHIDFLKDQIVSNGTSTIQWNVLGIIYVS